jgi:signal transduction histidine kinase
MELNPSELPRNVKDAVFTGMHTINPSGEEQATGLGILVQQTRAIGNFFKLEGLTSGQIAEQVQEEIAELVTQFIVSFETSKELVSEKQKKIVKQVQEEIIRQAQEEIMELVIKEAPEYAKNNVIDLEQLPIVLAEELIFDRRSVYDLRILQINPVVTHQDKVVRNIIGEDIVLETKLAPDLWWSKFDLQAMAQVFRNLVVNACEAMPEGGHLTIETSNVVLDDDYAAHHPELQSGEYVVLVIHDTGYGISNEIKDHIFEPFFTTKNEEHPGLGLASVFGYVRQFGGQIQVHSGEGVGSTFKIYLPRVAEPDPQPNLLEANIEVRNLIKRNLAVIEAGKLSNERPKSE